jgi:hypothetical protein
MHLLKIFCCKANFGARLWIIEKEIDLNFSFTEVFLPHSKNATISLHFRYFVNFYLASFHAQDCLRLQRRVTLGLVESLHIFFAVLTLVCVN